MINIELQAKFDNFIKLRESLFYFLESYRCKSSVISETLIVAEEIFTNIIKHAYKKESSELIYIEIKVINNILIMTFKDRGTKFENIKIPRSLSEIKEEIGGLGLYLISRLSDSYDYRREGEWNINEIRKYLIMK